MTDLEVAHYLDKQHPNPWDGGRWYPASLPVSGAKVEIRRTSGKGRNHGYFLHARRAVRLTVRNLDGTISDLGPDYIHVRFNLSTGECKEL